MSEYEPRPFVCERCLWILGESYRPVNARVTKLRIYRLTRAPQFGMDTSEARDHVKYSGEAINDGDAVCGHCGCRTHWNAGEAALREMLERRSNRNRLAMRLEVEHG
jgi:hypothetical protein